MKTHICKKLSCIPPSQFYCYSKYLKFETFYTTGILVLKLMFRIPAEDLGHPEMTGISRLFWNSIILPVAGDRNRNPEKTTKFNSI
jgi:hypothetical protein